MLSKKIINKLVEKAVKESFKDGKLQESIANRFSGEFASLPKAEGITLLSLYLKGVKRELNKQTLVIESAVSLQPAKISQIEKEIKKKRRVASIESRVNSGLLGGLKIKIGDEVYEGSLLKKIEELGNFIKES
jgi:F-type H+-transporting ATPase subunit delta